LDDFEGIVAGGFFMSFCGGEGGITVWVEEVKLWGIEVEGYDLVLVVDDL
jgi:hypothetical protein